MQLKPEGTLLGLRDALLRQGVRYSEIKMASLQRGYEWEEKNWKALFEDTKRESTKEYPPGYTALKGPFIGVFILTELEQGNDENGHSLPHHCEVVDGQQRVTTTFIFAAILRDYLDNLTERLILAQHDDPGITSQVLGERVAIVKNQANQTVGEIRDFLQYEWPDKARTPRLRTWSYLDDVVAEGIYTEKHYLGLGKIKFPPAKDPTTKFLKASVGLNDLVKQGISDIELEERNNWADDPDVEVHVLLAKIEFLRNLYHTLVERMFVVKLSTPNVRDAGEVFLSLNSKGKALDTKDIVKAALLDLHSDTIAESKDFASKWAKLDKQVIDLNAFLRLAWMTKNGTKTSGKNVAVEISEYLDKNPLTAKTTASELAKLLFKFGGYVESMVSAKTTAKTIISDPKKDPYSVTRLVALNDVGSAYRFFLLPHTEALKDGRKDVGTSEEAIRLLYTLAFTGKTVFDLPQAMEDFYFGLGAKIRNPKPGENPMQELRDKVSEAVGTFVAGQQGNANALLILHALEEAWRECHKNPSAGWKEIFDSVEHTAPQSPKDYWVKALNPLGSLNFSYDKTVLFMGNLVHLNRRQNSRIQQKPWIDASAPDDVKKSKRAAFDKADYFTTQHCAKLPTWGMPEINARTRWVEEMIVKIYDPSLGNVCAIVNFYDWYQARSPRN